MGDRKLSYLHSAVAWWLKLIDSGEDDDSDKNFDALGVELN